MKNNQQNIKREYKKRPRNKEHTFLEYLLSTLIYSFLIYGAYKFMMKLSPLLINLYNYFNISEEFLIVLGFVALATFMKYRYNNYSSKIDDEERKDEQEWNGLKSENYNEQEWADLRSNKYSRYNKSRPPQP